MKQTEVSSLQFHEKRERFGTEFAQVRRLVFSYLENTVLSLNNHLIYLDIKVITSRKHAYIILTHLNPTFI